MKNTVKSLMAGLMATGCLIAYGVTWTHLETGGADRFRLITTMGGCVFGDSPAQASGLMLQTGRIEE